MKTKLVLVAMLLALSVWVVAQATPAAVQITQGPRVENTTDTSAVIAWSTNVNSSTILKYGTDKTKLDQTKEAPWGGTTHRVTLTGLQPSTTYYFQVEATQAQGSGTGAEANVTHFTTKPAGQH